MTDRAAPAPPAFAHVHAGPAWRCIDLVSDIHLGPHDTATASAFIAYLDRCPADALFILGDLFEVWIGDDELDAADISAPTRACLQALHALAQRCAVHLMHGNRDFLLGERFARAAGAMLLPDPAVLHWQGQRTLLTHGDALCLDDRDYQAFRAQVRTPAWQQAFLSAPLADRRAQAQRMRAASQAHQAQATTWADADTVACQQWLDAADARVLVHGHTHQPARHELGHGRRRLVLSDWEAAAHPPHLQVLRCRAEDHAFGGWHRVDLAPADA